MSEPKIPESAIEHAKARFNAFKLKYPLLLAAVLSYACFEESGATSIPLSSETYTSVHPRKRSH